MEDVAGPEKCLLKISTYQRKVEETDGAEAQGGLPCPPSKSLSSQAGCSRAVLPSRGIVHQKWPRHFPCLSQSPEAFYAAQKVLIEGRSWKCPSLHSRERHIHSPEITTITNGNFCIVDLEGLQSKRLRKREGA